jgi:hypothetical protein
VLFTRNNYKISVPAVSADGFILSVVNNLTAYGHSLKPIINEMSSWGIQHRERVIKEMSAK